MTRPHLTFFCEVPSVSLADLFSSGNPEVISSLLQLNASLSLGMIDLTPERAEVVRQLNRAGVPVVAWLLLPVEYGYWFNCDNHQYASQRYQQFISWTREHDLHWAGIGMDIEPDICELELVSEQGWKALLRLAPTLFKRLVNYRRVKLAQAAYTLLVDQIRADGYPVESYQFPVIEDERLARTTIIKRLAGLVDIPVDREVWILYSSFVRPHGVGMLWSYASQAEAIALGSTGGGVENPVGDRQVLGWDELERDLRLAWHHSQEIYIFSLEGCIQQGYLTKLLEFQWDYPVLFPVDPAHRVDRFRRRMRSILWILEHLRELTVGGILIGLTVRRLLKRTRY